MSPSEQLKRLINEYPELQPTPLEVLTRLCARFGLGPPDTEADVEDETQRVLDAVVARYGNVVQAQPGEVEGVALVRDAEGKPKIANIHGIPHAIWAVLSDDERREIKGRGGYPSHQ